MSLCFVLLEKITFESEIGVMALLEFISMVDVVDVNTGLKALWTALLDLTGRIR